MLLEPRVTGCFLSSSEQALPPAIYFPLLLLLRSGARNIVGITSVG
ncbi:predicted coding region TP0137 [Treponema pallidum subsp. pallidum str. Nichols]|uniref:Uncharacterized protein TP_0137 n=2 Tax=Treponema pallidum subsp. pallidum TaxID=161 RepID=Y137_TREPA|nr:RecName: Full=Uncharacterized protein TP_0137 [Treponema pallidum subsp. pallidum str. Nichols]AAC65138.1 predicted coding region TP0137 [Treponema pallidum subsp. pallidum str. Nichols]ADR64411.1 hypothetical protein [Treponema pallidum subsp. pallidum]